MNKVELFDIYQKHSTADFMVWDAHFNWRLKQAGVTRTAGKIEDSDHDEWLGILKGMPHNSDWRPTIDNMIIVSWGEDNDETFPINFLDDLDKEPDLEMMWHSGYYDGPLSGMAKYNGENVWFDCKIEDDWGDRIYELFRLSKEDEAELFRRHKLWQDLVGFHSDHHPNVYKQYDGGADPKKYYKLQEKFSKLDIKSGEIVGEAHWFQFLYWGRPR